MNFPRNQRLLTKAEIQAIFAAAKKATQHGLLALYIKNDKNYARLGMMVGKRITKSAVGRNRIKRIIRESFRHHKDLLKGKDVLIIARQNCDKLTNQLLRKGIDRLWEKLPN